MKEKISKLSLIFIIFFVVALLVLSVSTPILLNDDFSQNEEIETTTIDARTFVSEKTGIFIFQLYPLLEDL